MPTPDQLQAFVTAADEGSFSAAARKLGKAQSAVSTAVINLEIDIGATLFDRSGRHPQLSTDGTALLKSARAVLQSHYEFDALARAIGDGVETRLTIAIEQGLFVDALKDILCELAARYTQLDVELLEPGINEVAAILSQGRADVGMMMEQEDYPQGFHFRGIGCSRQLPVCAPDHPLASIKRVTHADLRRYRQLIAFAPQTKGDGIQRDQKSPKQWISESPYIVLDLLTAGLGWAVLPQTVVAEKMTAGDLVRLRFDFQEPDIQQGVDVVWTDQRPLGVAGQWFLQQLLSLDADLWSKS